MQEAALGANQPEHLAATSCGDSLCLIVSRVGALLGPICLQKQGWLLQ